MGAFIALLPGLGFLYLSISMVWDIAARLRRGETDYPVDPLDPESGGDIRSNLPMSIFFLGIGIAFLALSVCGYLFTD